MPYKLLKLKQSLVSKWNNKQANHCFSDSCPAPGVTFEEGEYAVVRTKGGRHQHRRYHPVCANEKNITYE